MALTNDFIEAVQSGKALRVRIILKDILLVDPTCALFDEREQYAVSRIPDLYTEHDGEVLNFDVSAWNENYLDDQMVIVVNNFSKERIELLKSMVGYLYKEKADKIRTEKVTTSSSPHITRKQIGTGVTVAGGAVAVAGGAMTVAGICTLQIPLAVIGGVVAVGGLAAAAGGVALTIHDKGNV